MYLQNTDGEKVPFTVTAPGQVYKQTFNGRIYVLWRAYQRKLGYQGRGKMYRLQGAWAYFGRYKIEVCDSPGVHLRLKIQMLKAER